MIPAMLAAFALIAAACGGGGSGTGSDEDYVRAICKAGNNFDAALEDVGEEAQKIFEDADSESDFNEKFLALYVGPFGDFADDLDKANPPADVKESHDELVSAIRTMVKQIEDGDQDALENADEGLDGIEPSQAIQDRLQAVADNVAECEGSDFFD